MGVYYPIVLLFFDIWGILWRVFVKLIEWSWIVFFIDVVWHALQPGTYLNIVLKYWNICCDFLSLKKLIKNKQPQYIHFVFNYWLQLAKCVCK